jgi:hypothetical protein
MTTADYSIPPLRNLPPGRLNQRRDHLHAEITSGSPRRRPLLNTQMTGRKRWAHRPLLVAAAAVVASVLAGGAFAVAHYVFLGGPAPADVRAQVEFESRIKATLQSHAAATGAIVSETKAAAVLATAGGPAYLWLTPTTSGGYCLNLDFANLRQPNGAPNLSGGCATDHAYAIDATFTWSRVFQTPVSLVYGYAAAPATRVEVRFESGATKSADLNGRYFMLEVPAGESPGARDQVVSVDALASDGHVIATQVKGQLAPTASP